MKQFLLVIVLAIFCNLTFATGPHFSWAVSAYGSNLNEVKSTAVDGQNNIYAGVSTYISSQLDFDILKYDANGNLLWTKSFGGLLDDNIYALATDHTGNVIIAGNFQGQIDFGSFHLVSVGNYDLFVAKLDPQGNVIWAKRAGGYQTGPHPDEDGVHGLTCDANNNIYMTGWLIDSAQYDNIKLHAFGDSDFFVAKMNSSGDFLWARAGGTYFSSPCTIGDRECGKSVAVDPAGNVYICGRICGSVMYADNLTVNCPGVGYAAFLAKYDQNGTIGWLKVYGGTQEAAGNAVAAAPDGVYLTGYIMGDVNFNIGTATSIAPHQTMYLVKVNAGGTEQWLRSVVSGNQYTAAGICGNSVTADAAGNVFVGGNYATGVVFEGDTLPWSALNPNIFVGSYSPSGTFRWVKPAVGLSTDNCYSVSLLSNSDVILGGGVWYVSHFDSITTNEPGYLLARISDSGNPNGIEELQPTFSIYPNPARTRVTIETAETGELRATLYDVSGRLVSEQQVVDHQFELGNIAEGAYLLRVGHSDKLVKLFVER